MPPKNQSHKFEDIITALEMLEQDRLAIECKMRICPDSIVPRCQIFLERNRALEATLMKDAIGCYDFDWYAYLRGQNFAEGWSASASETCGHD